MVEEAGVFLPLTGGKTINSWSKREGAGYIEVRGWCGNIAKQDKSKTL